MKPRSEDPAALPAHLAVWPRHDDPGFEGWFRDRWAWGRAHGEPKMAMLRERRRRWLAEMEPAWAAYRAEHGLPDDEDGAA